MKDNEFKCFHCGGVFEKDWTDEEAKAESIINGFTGDNYTPDELCIVCDDCYIIGMNSLN